MSKPTNDELKIDDDTLEEWMGGWSNREWFDAQRTLDQRVGSFGVYKESRFLVLVELLEVAIDDPERFVCRLRFVEPLSAMASRAYARETIEVFEVSTQRNSWNQLWMFYPLTATDEPSAKEEVRHHPNDRRFLERFQPKEFQNE